MCRRAGARAEISGDPAIIAGAEKLILPGVGHFGRAMQRLSQCGLLSALNEAVRVRGAPILGICLGMQLFSSYSEEGDAAGLGWIAARTVRFSESHPGLKVPHMGWNEIVPERQDLLFERLPERSRFYFVHSYHVVCEHDGDVLAKTQHGEPLVSAVRHANIWGTQFHPEKSHKFGLAIIRNFIERIECRAPA